MTAPFPAPLRRRIQLTLLALCLAGCAARSTPPQTAGSSPPAAAVNAPPAALHWLRNSAEYRANALQAYALATRLVTERTAGRGDGKWVVALDADETVLDNSQFEVEQHANSASFTEESWHAWCRRGEAGAVPGAVAFLKRVRELGGHIAIVTNRDVEVAEETAANLRALGVPFDVLLPRDGNSEKEPRWQSLEDGTASTALGPLEIVLFVGDNIKDFPGFDQSARQEAAELFAPFGERYVILPNPVYGSWQRTPFR